MTSFEIFELKEFLARRFEELGGQKGASAPPVVRPLPSRESFCGRDFGLIQGARAQLAPPIPALAQGPPLLVTTVDAEEAFDWSLPLSRYSGNVGSIRVQGQAHKIYDRYNIIPIYFVTYPVAIEAVGRSFLLELLDGGKCEIGSQLHSWVTPPFDEAVNLHNSFAGNLPKRLEYEKLKTLTNVIEEQFGLRPTAYRAGRYGIGPNTIKTLRALGYKIDSSVVPEQSYRHEGGPQFFGWPVVPWWLDEERSLLEIPLTSSYVGHLADSAGRFADGLFAQHGRYAVIRSLMARSGLLERVRLTPEGTDIHEAKRLVRVLLLRGVRIFTLSYHAPSLVPGCTPYVRSERDLDRFMRWLDEFYEFFLAEIGGTPATTAEIYRIGRIVKNTV